MLSFDEANLSNAFVIFYMITLLVHIQFFSVCSVMYHCDITLLVPDQSDVVPASKDDIIDTACEICKLLKYEFICIPVSLFQRFT